MKLSPRSSEAGQSAFDAAAATYDDDFTHSVIGRLQRRRLWSLYDRLFGPGSRLLDLGCGTGEDALHFARRGHEVEGVDLSPAMIEAAALRIEREGLQELAAVQALPLERLDELPERGFDGAYSSFSPFNCVADLRPAARALAERLRPGAPLALCLMSRYCLWETLLLPVTRLLHGAARRRRDDWAPAARDQDEPPLLYHRISAVRRSFAPWFELLEAPGLGVFVPPTYLEPWAQRHPAWMQALARADSLFAGRLVFRALADHRVVILRRTASPA